MPRRRLIAEEWHRQFSRAASLAISLTDGAAGAVHPLMTGMLRRTLMAVGWHRHTAPTLLRPGQFHQERAVTERGTPRRRLIAREWHRQFSRAASLAIPLVCFRTHLPQQPLGLMNQKYLDVTVLSEACTEINLATQAYCKRMAPPILQGCESGDPAGVLPDSPHPATAGPDEPEASRSISCITV